MPLRTIGNDEDFMKYLKERCRLSCDKHFPCKRFCKNKTFIKEFSPKLSCRCFWVLEGMPGLSLRVLQTLPK